MNKFIEIESRHGRLFYINVAHIVCIENFSTFRIISLTDKDNIETFESYESIKAKIDKDVEVVRHGEWIRKDFKPCGHDYICSLCGYAVPQTYKHCPECMAKMDGERSEE